MTPRARHHLTATRGAGPVAIALALVITAITLLARPAVGQTCGGQRSTCRACHEERGERPVGTDGTSWHGDHALGDFCASCHGGDPAAEDRDLAHADLVAPLAADRCAACHDDPAALIARYDAERVSRPPPSGPAGAPARGAAPSPAWPNLVAAALALALAVGGAIAIARVERRRRGRRARPLHRAVLAAIRAPGWSPTTAGVALGVVITASLALGHRLSGAAAYQQIGGAIGARVAPRSIYWDHVVGPLTLSWDLWGLFGVMLGALASSLAAGTFRFRTMPDRGWAEVHGSSVAVRWTIAFVGSALTAFAAGIAGGCTASLAMSGGAVLVPGAFAFMAGMFAGGIPTALVVHRRGGAP